MKKVGEFIIFALIGIWVFIIIFLAPLVTAWGVVTGRLDIETLEPPSPSFESVEEQIRSEQMIW